MKDSEHTAYHPGRRYVFQVPRECDLTGAIKNFCKENAIQSAVFSVIGIAESATIGVYDSAQYVYVTHVEESATEILSCLGNVVQQNGLPCVAAKIILADQQGNLTGGHLFSQTVVLNAEVDLQELIGESLNRSDVPETGFSVMKKNRRRSLSP